MTVYDGDTGAEGSPHPGIRPLRAGMRWLLVVASLLVFIIGIPLFLLSEQTDRYFAWTISVPLTAAFLGAGYWSSFFIEFVASRERAWANTRLMAAARARGDVAALERLRAELAWRAAAKLDELARAPEVLFYLWIKGFGVRLDQP